MMEKPNLSFIIEIAGDDEAFQNSILEIIKTEFREEVNLFKTNFSSKKYKEAAHNVHKIKHKIGLLGLEKALIKASEFEKALKIGNTTLHHSFLEILNKIHVYLYP
jgi:hypothetical protein